jgi:hypothetical protein
MAAPTEPPGAEQANPYIAGSPVTVSDMFFGREDVFDFVRQALVGRHRDNVIVLYGQRRTGKTSILYHLQRQLGARYVCVFVDLHALALEGFGTALWELASSIGRVLRREHHIEVPRPERGAFLDDPRGQFENEFLAPVLEAIGDRRLLLMLDEVIRIQEQIEAGRLDADIFAYLRHLMQHYEGLSFLFSLGSGLEELSRDYALLFSVALYKRISFLDHDAAVALITQPASSLYTVEPDAVERILEITCGHPYFTQLVCHGLFNRWQRQRAASVRRADVDAVLDEAVERGLAVLKHVWEESTPAEKAVMAAMAAASQSNDTPVRADDIGALWLQRGVALPEREVSGAVQSLLARDTIAGRDAYSFAVDLQRRWVQQYRRIEWVHEEIAAEIPGWAEPADAEPRTPPTSASPSAKTNPAPPTAGGRDGQLMRMLPFLALALAVAAAVWTVLRPAPAPVTNTNAATPMALVLAGAAAQVNDLAVSDGAIWAATEGGLVRWNPDGSAQVLANPQGMSLGFSDNARQSLALAADGSMWIGAGGVAHARASGDRISGLGFYDRDDGLGMGVVSALVVDHDGSVWAGGAPDSGRPPPLSHFDGSIRDGNAWHTLDVPLDDPSLASLELRIWSILRSRDGALWLGLARDGVLRWDGTRWTRFAPAQGIPTSSGARCPADVRVRRLVQDSGGGVWAAGSCQGLLRLDVGSGQAQPVPVAGGLRTIQTLMLASGGTLWTAGDGHVAYTADGQNWTTVGSDADGLGTDSSAMVEAPDRSTWLGDYGSGVSVFANGAWRHLQR